MVDYSKIVAGEPPFKTHDEEISEPLEEEIRRLKEILWCLLSAAEREFNTRTCAVASLRALNLARSEFHIQGSQP